MATITGAITSLVTSAVSWVGSYIGVIMEQPLLLAFAVLSLVGLGVGLISRMMHL